MFTPERSARWQAAAAYEDGLRRTIALLDGADAATLAAPVPACPLWSVQDLVAHLAGEADDARHGRFFPDALRAPDDPAVAARRERWTAGHVTARGAVPSDTVVGELQRRGCALAAALRRGDPAACDVPEWMVSAPVADLAVHLGDLREALGLPPAPDSPIARAGFSLYRAWLGARVTARGLAPLRLVAGDREWLLGGDGEPGAVLRGEPHELFRAITGRRPLAEVKTMAWNGDPSAYLPVLSPYPLAERPLVPNIGVSGP